MLLNTTSRLICLLSLLALCYVSGAMAVVHDVRLVIDVSGSMKKNDPSYLRRPALELLVKLLPENSVAGIWTFGEGVNTLVEHRKVNDDWRKKALSKASQINSVALFTNIGGALEKAAYDQRSPDSEKSPHIILLTDGMVDIDKDPEINQQEWRRIVDEVLPGYQKADYKVHTIALSPNADKDLMKKLSLETGGSTAVAETSQELMTVFLGIFDQAVPVEQLPLTENQFLTDSSIEEFTALIFKDVDAPSATLIGPDNKTYSQSMNDESVNWFSTEQYDLITVTRPVEGEWQVRAKLKPQSRITVVSDLNLVVERMPSILTLNDDLSLTFHLEEDGKVIDRAEFLALLDIVYELKNTSTDDEPWQGSLSDGPVPGNGIYTNRFGRIKQPGEYTLTIKVDGKTFKRQFIHRFSIRNPFDVEVTPLSDEKGIFYQVMVSSNTAGLDLSQTEVVGKLKKPSGSSQIMSFSLTPKDQWALRVKPEEDGRYEMSIRFTTIKKSGEREDNVLDTVAFNYPPGVDVPVQPKDELEVDSSAQVDSDFLTSGSEAEETEAEKEPKEESSNVLLYSILGVANLLIVVVAFVLYKLFSKGNQDDPTDASPEDETEPKMDSLGEELPQMDSLDEEPSFDEPPLASVELDEDGESIDLAVDEPIPDLMDDDDEEPEFSLDDFAPDTLDDDEFDLDDDKKD